MARKTKEDALETRSQLLDAAERVFLEKGFSHSSLNDVACAAGVTRGAVYWHFKNKGDLFEALVERVRLPSESIGDCCAEHDDPNPLGRLHEFATSLLRETAVNQRRQRVFTILFHRFEFNKEARAIQLRHQAAFMDSLHRVQDSLHSAVAKTQLPSDLDIQRSAVAFQAYFTGILANWLFMPRSFDLQNGAEALAEGFFDMLKYSPAMRLQKDTNVLL